MKCCFRNNILLTFSDYGGKSELGIYKNKKSRELISVDYIDLINRETKTIANSLLVWIKANSIDLIYNYETNIGIFNHVAIRHNDKMQFMLEFYFHEYDETVINRLKCWNISNYNIVSMYYQIESKNKNDFRANFRLLKGEYYLYYTICDKMIGIKAGSFFQTNNAELNIMYNDIMNKFNKNDQFIFLDLYCGVGVMSIIMAQYYKKCIGIEINQNAINVAEHNMVKNNISNCDFMCNPVEEIINNNHINISSITDEDIIIFVNPPRRGLYKTVIQRLNSLKSTGNVKQIFYLSCCLKTLERDLKLLDYNSKILEIYDMFPKTNHKEYLVELF
jgi:23S rRNA (uracil1939-C5)-methyltransferase